MRSSILSFFKDLMIKRRSIMVRRSNMVRTSGMVRRRRM
jgi:hypothetical protein